MLKKYFAVCLLTVSFLGIPFFFYGQTEAAQSAGVRIGFYNAENYFDPFPDSTASYHQYEPEGDHHWNREKYQRKRRHIFKVLAAMGGWHGMDVMAFAEIENRYVLEDLLKSTPLGKDGYGIVHYPSPDHRGIEVGLIYRKSTVQLLFSKAIPVKTPDGQPLKTRDILYVKFKVGADTLHLFVNHWPSRYGGLMATRNKRVLAAKILMQAVDSVCRFQRGAAILVLGDFNETIQDMALQQIVLSDSTCPMYPLSSRFVYGLAGGSLKGKSGWSIFDRVFCSKNMLSKNEFPFVVDKSFHIFDAPFLLEKDKNNLGLKPNRTYNGFVWHGGFSDHLPVFVDVRVRKER